MSQTLALGRQLAKTTARFGWYYGINRLMEGRARRLSRDEPQAANARIRPTRPVPSERDLMGELLALIYADARAVRQRVYPAMEQPALPPAEHLRRLRAMFADMPDAMRRRAERDAGTARETVGGTDPDLPDYFKQDFHFQAGGYLTAESARLYDVQVETLFYGTAALMRRAALKPIAAAIAGRDQRHLSLLDVACGTGRFLREVRLAYPAIHLTGLDLSQAYLDEACRHLGDLRRARLLAANAEHMPLPDADQDVITCVFLLHELPPQARDNVISDAARVLKPGGTLIVVDSLQMGDRPGWDGMLETFPVRFHEPYYRHYAIDDLRARFRAAGLEHVQTSLAFLAKVMVWRKP